MFPRTTRVHFKYFGVTHFTVSRYNSTKNEFIRPSKKLVESAVIWNHKCSCLTDINVFKNKPGFDLVKKGKIEEALLIYPQINKEFLKNKTVHPSFKKILSQKVDGDNLTFNKISSTSYDNINCISSNKNQLHKKTQSSLPTDVQLDEMMAYFQDQASLLFTNAGWSYRKCSYNIIFENMLLGTKTESLNVYIMQVNCMKNITKFFLSNPQMQIVRMTKNISDGTIQVRWQVQGIPRHFLPLTLFFDEGRYISYIDGFSIFFVNNDGLYHRHILMKMTPSKTEKKSGLSLFLDRFRLESPGLESLPKQPVLPTFHDTRK